VAKAQTKERKREWGVVRYLRETRAELSKVHWPSQEEARNLTILVLVVTIGMAALLGLLDFFFSWELAGVIDGQAVQLMIAVVLVVIIGAGMTWIARQE